MHHNNGEMPRTQILSKFWIFTHDKVGLRTCPYLERWILKFPKFSVRLYKWTASDDQRYPHDHESWYISLVLFGSYLDVTEERSLKRRFLSLHKFPATHRHKVKLLSKVCWTLLIFGPKQQDFGFYVDGKFVKRNRYFFDIGHHPCE